MTEPQTSKIDLAQLLTDCACILDVVKGEWGEAWSEWDQGVRDRITKQLVAIYDARVTPLRPATPEPRDG